MESKEKPLHRENFTSFMGNHT